MKAYLGLLLTVTVLSCSEHKPEPLPSRPKLVSKDSGVVKAGPVNPYAPVDLSPMDMSYLPENYTKLSERKTAPIARIIYSRPQKQGRKIFGELIKYGELWRLGANEATEIEFFQAVRIQNKLILPGRYITYAIPQEGTWTIVLNTGLNSWGLSINPRNDKYRFDIPVKRTDQSIEYFTMAFQSRSGGADLVMAWDDAEARLPIVYGEN
ncbi:MAG TPA: DUF2911 domain-containing protein [Flavisolibacter sp.]|nr:DUF2911 domain-containing protein [Flavisolibacter sp.]